MAEISSLGYLGFGVSDLARWETLLVDVLGLQAGERDGHRSLALRMDDRMQRVVLEHDGCDDLSYAGWMFDTEAELEDYVRALAAKGLAVNVVDREATQRRCVEKAYACMDPNGLRHEFAFGMKFAAERFASKVLNKGFVTGRLGMGHILVAGRNYPATLDFARQILGLRLSDYVRAPLETPHGVVQVDATFFHTVTGRHHSLAAAAVPFPKKLHHFMLEVEDFNDVGMAHDRCAKAGFPVATGLGHHPNDQMFSFYVVTPSSVQLEFGHGGLVIDDRDWEVKTYSQLSDWGHISPCA